MVRELQILPEIPKIPPQSGMRHIATSYEISYSPYFETIGNNVRDESQIIVSNLEDTVNLNKFNFTLKDVTETTEIFARFKLHFEIVTGQGSRRADSGWSSVVNLHGDMEGFKVSDVILATPRIFIEEYTTSGYKEYLKVTCLPMEIFIGYGDHTATSWSVTDSDGQVLFERRKSKNQLTSIIIEKPANYHDKALIIKCQHHSSTNADSNIGTYVYNQGLASIGLYSLTFESGLISKRDFYVQMHLRVNKFVGFDIVIKDKNDIVVAEYLNNTTLYPKFKLPELVKDNMYYIYSRLQYEPGKYTAWKLESTMAAKENSVLDINPFVEYDSDYRYTQKLIQPGSKFYMVRELPEGGIILPKSDTSTFKGLGYFIMDGAGIRYVDDIKGTDNIGDNKDLSNYSVNVIPLYNGHVIINRTELQSSKDKEGLGKTVFLKYSTNKQTAEFKLLGSANPNKQLGSTGVSGSAVALIDNNVYYVPHKEGSFKTPTKLNLYKLDTETMITTKVTDLPFEAYSYVSLCLLNNDEFLVLGGTENLPLGNPKDYTRNNDVIYKYNIKSNSFSSVGDLSTTNTRNWYNLHAVPRVDGKIAIFNQSEGAGVAEDQSILLLDLKTGLVTNTQNDFKDGRVYSKTIWTNNGNIYRISNSPVEPQEVYVHKPNTTTVPVNGDPVYQDAVVTDLVVPEGKTVVIDNPYKYSTITILGDIDAGTSGTLVWLSPTKRTEYKADTLFITKSMELYNNNIDKLTKDKKWNNIILLDGVNISISSGDADDPVDPTLEFVHDIPTDNLNNTNGNTVGQPNSVNTGTVPGSTSPVGTRVSTGPSVAGAPNASSASPASSTVTSSSASSGVDTSTRTSTPDSTVDTNPGSGATTSVSTPTGPTASPTADASTGTTVNGGATSDGSTDVDRDGSSSSEARTDDPQDGPTAESSDGGDSSTEGRVGDTGPGNTESD